ncbi:MAG: DUF1761 domain-containing protein [Candidatus Dojkabacteria bacterium]|nr:DUF1761 domain-containing protein [Candidatus Dojkabacteria bacterium]
MIEVLNAEISVIGIVIAAIANIFLGMIWYGPLFGKEWMRLVGIKKEDTEPNPSSYAISIGSALLTASVMSLFISYGYISSLLGDLNDGGILFGKWEDYIAGIMVAMLAWLGFIVTSSYNKVLWESSDRKLFMINAFHQLASLIIMGVIVAVSMDLKV